MIELNLVQRIDFLVCGAPGVSRQRWQFWSAGHGDFEQRIFYIAPRN